MWDILVSYLNFVLFLGIIYYFGRKSLNDMSRKRAEDFEKSFQEADTLRKSAEKKCKEIDEKLAKMDTEIFSLRENLRNEALAEADKIVTEAKKLAENIRVEAQKQAKAEVLKASTELQDFILTQVQSAVTGELKKSFTPEHQIGLIKNQLSELRQLRG